MLDVPSVLLIAYLRLLFAEADPKSLFVFAKYIAEIITNGDFLNGWLNMLPTDISPFVLEVGAWLSEILGF